MAVELAGQIPGGNPRDAGAISQRDGVFHIAPFSEDGDANYKFHLLVQAANPSSRAEEIAVEGFVRLANIFAGQAKARV